MPSQSFFTSSSQQLRVQPTLLKIKEVSERAVFKTLNASIIDLFFRPCVGHYFGPMLFMALVGDGRYFGAWTGVFRYFPGIAQAACGECELVATHPRLVLRVL